MLTSMNKKIATRRSFANWKPAVAVGVLTILSCSAVIAEEKSTTVEVFGETMTVPAEFDPAEAKSRIIEHEYAVQKGEGDDAPTARLTMMAAGGGVEANLQRWKGQFSGDDKKVGEAETFDAGPFKVHVLQVSGQYAETMGGGPFFGGKKVMRDDYAMLGAIMIHPKGGSYFVKMIGPEAVVLPSKDAFMGMLKSVGE